jgi:hypothetical protein
MIVVVLVRAARFKAVSPALSWALTISDMNRASVIGFPGGWLLVPLMPSNDPDACVEAPWRMTYSSKDSK